jgi:hypothetical protein
VPSPLLRKVERIGGSRNCVKAHSRLPHSLLSQTSTDCPKCKQPFTHSHFRGNDRSYSRHESSGHSQVDTNISKLYFKLIPGTENRRYTTSDFQSKSFKQICKGRKVSSHKHVSSTRISPTTGLVVQNRFESGLFSCKYSRNSQTLPTHNLQQRVVRNDLPTIWSVHSSQSLLNSHELDSTKVTPRKCANPSLPGRFSISTSRPSSSQQSCQNDSKYTSNPRVVRQPRKVSNDPSDKSYISGYLLEPVGQSKIFTRSKNNQFREKSSANLTHSTSDFKRNTEPCRSFELREFCCATGKIVPSQSSNVPEYHTASPVKEICSSPSGSSRVKMVGPGMPPFNNAPPSPCEALSHNGCIRSCLGSSVKQYTPKRILVPRGTESSLQSKGDVSYFSCRTSSPKNVESQLNFNTMRQQDGGVLPSKRGGNQIYSIDGDNTQTPIVTRQSSNSLHSTIYSGQIQQPCRSPVQTSSSSRMALNTAVSENHIYEMGNSDDRSFCLRESPRSLQLCLSRSKGHQSTVSRRLQCDMELPHRLGISTTISDTQSVSTSQPVNGNIPNRSSPMAQSVLESGPPSESPRRPICFKGPGQMSNRYLDRPATSTGEGPVTRSMEMWGWSKEISDWNSSQVSLLKGSWRPSTLKTYRVAWNRWLAWAKCNNIDFQDPTGSQLAQYLADLHLNQGLSYNTILLHKSVVSTLCNADLTNQLSSHVLVKHILKSISLKNTENIHKPPIWDVDDLILYLTTYKIDENNIYQIYFFVRVAVFMI